VHRHLPCARSNTAPATKCGATIRSRRVIAFVSSLPASTIACLARGTKRLNHCAGSIVLWRKSGADVSVYCASIETSHRNFCCPYIGFHSRARPNDSRSHPPGFTCPTMRHPAPRRLDPVSDSSV
jgi:hypothetical protein